MKCCLAFHRNCSSHDTRDKPRNGDVLGNLAVECYGDHGNSISVSTWPLSILSRAHLVLFCCTLFILFYFIFLRLQHLVLLGVAALYCTSQILHFLQIEDLWQPCVKQVYWCHFSNSIFSLGVTFWQFLQYFKLFHDCYICYGLCNQ